MASKPQNIAELGEKTVPSEETYFGWIYALCVRGWKAAEYSSLYLAVIAIAEVYIVMALLSLPMSSAPLVVGLLTFAIYANDRLIDVDSDMTSSPRRTAFIRRYKGVLYVAAALSYGGAVALAVTGGPMAFGLTLLPGAVWVLYAVDWAPEFAAPFERLKEILILNSVLVAASWSVTVVLVPVAFANTTPTGTGGVVLLYFVFATFVNTEIANVGDVASDRQSGVSTMPTAFGVGRTRQCLSAVTVLVGLLLGTAVVVGFLTMLQAAVLSLGVICLLGVTALVGRTNDSDRLAIAAEFTRLPVFVALLFLAVTG